jgi:N-acetylated-alpha-linked acidic dipeptidase
VKCRSHAFAKQALSVLLILVCTPAVVADEPRLSGFTPASSPWERQWERKFRDALSPRNMRDYMQLLSARPHHVGSAADKQNADWILGKFNQWGWQTHIESFDVLFPTPTERLVELLEPAYFKATLDEPALPADPTSSQKQEQLPSYNAYSGDGDVTAPLVYVNYGLAEDYEELERMGLTVKGAIVIARYGVTWRGVKPKVAAEHGAIGCLIYSDPKDDGYFVDDVYPNGPMRPKDGVQRGSVMDFASSSPGDPLTPGIGATKGATRLDLKNAKSITKIPVLPISYGDAQPLLAALKGPVAPESWRGALPITYHVGSPAKTNTAKVHLLVKSNWELKPIYDVIATLPGAVEPEHWILRGNHQDAWVNGAEDPVSGLTALLEEARSLGELSKQGWKPSRTLVYCVWDGEEPFLLGSTEWAETHAEELQQHAVIYINTDSNARGFLTANGSHSLERLVNDVARDIADPEANMSVGRRLQLYRISTTGSSEVRKELWQRSDWRLGPLGSGSDFSPFIDHLGIATLDLAFTVESPDGIYHSAYDDLYWYTHFADRDFVYGRALAQLVGTAAMRMADSEILPLEFVAQADTFGNYLEELKRLLHGRQEGVRERNQEIEQGLFAAINDPQHPRVPPAREEVPPFLNFAPLENALETLSNSAKAYQDATTAWNGQPSLPFTQINTALIQTERQLLSPEGLPGRSWYRHLIYAPGVYTGYDSKTMPGVREGIEQKHYEEADRQIAAIANALSNEAQSIDRATKLLHGTGP